MTKKEAVKLVSLERVRQDEMWGEHHDRQHSYIEWTAILGDQMGQICRAMLNANEKEYAVQAIQLGAVAVAFLEQLPRHFLKDMEKLYADQGIEDKD